MFEAYFWALGKVLTVLHTYIAYLQGAPWKIRGRPVEEHPTVLYMPLIPKTRPQKTQIIELSNFSTNNLKMGFLRDAFLDTLYSAPTKYPQHSGHAK